ncbi:MAG: response regulator [Spirochaetia bacterium]|nr:response regulator [Spirochaetia bacterium]
MNVFRIVVAIAALILATQTPAPPVVLVSGLVFLALSVGWLAVTVFGFVDQHAHTAWEYVITAIDIALISSYVYFTGGLNSFAIVAFYAETTLASLNTHRRQGLFSAIGGSIAYALIGTLTYLKVLPSVDFLGDTVPSSLLRLITAVSLVGIGNIGTNLLVRHLAVSLRTARDTAESANHAKSQFLAVMSHEIRTPLTGIIGAAALLNGENLSADQSRLSQIIQKSGNHLLRIINDILDFSRIEAGFLEIRKAPVNISGFVAEIRDSFKMRFLEKGTQLRTLTDEDAGIFVITDEGRLRQIVENLVNNAWKFTDAGEVALSIFYTGSSAEGALEIRIADTGTGISQAEQQKLFLPFSQVGLSQRRSRSGTGLGLVIVQRIVEALQGTIGIQSEIGRGTSVTVRLPVKRAPPIDIENTIETNPVPVGLAGLIVDDDAVSSTILEILLESLRVKPMVTDSAEGAIALASKSKFDFILTDVNLPAMSGLELVEKLRAMDILPPKVIVMSADASGEARHGALRAGADQFLLKPFVLEDLRLVLGKKHS